MADDLKLAKLISNDRFYSEIDHLVKVHGLNYLDAIVHYCEKNNMEVEAAASMVKSNFRIKSALQTEGEDLRFLPRSARLPI